MADSSQAPLKRTPFHAIHAALGAKLVPFAGYEMPVHYPAGITVEHKAVRERCGLFDVSHMGEFLVRGPGAVDFVNYVTTNNVASLALGQVQYSGILNDRGTFEDDCLVYREPDGILMVVNASNAAKDLAHIAPHAARFDCTLEDISDQVALLALQGPMARDVLQPLTDVALDGIKYYHFAKGAVAGVAGVYVSRTGYTGEDGFELYFPPAHAEQVWEGPHGRRAGDTGGTRLPRLAAAGDGDGAVWQRHRRHRHAARGQPGVDHQAGQGRLRGARCTRQAEGRRVSRASSSGSPSPTAPFLGTATRSSATVSPVARCAAGR